MSRWDNNKKSQKRYSGTSIATLFFVSLSVGLLAIMWGIDILDQMGGKFTP